MVKKDNLKRKKEGQYTKKILGEKTVELAGKYEEIFLKIDFLLRKKLTIPQEEIKEAVENINSFKIKYKVR